MRTVVYRPILVLVCAVAIHSTSAFDAAAQVAGPAPSSSGSGSFRMTPFMAMGDDLAPGGGAAFTFAWTRQLSVEAEASLGTDAARSSLSLLYALPQWGRVGVYLAGGGGVQRDEITGIGPGLDFDRPKKTEFAVNIGAGASIPISDRWAYRADFRWYNPKNEWPESWRVYSGLTLNVGR